jgi:hypothetical protein
MVAATPLFLKLVAQDQTARLFLPNLHCAPRTAVEGKTRLKTREIPAATSPLELLDLVLVAASTS